MAYMHIGKDFVPPDVPGKVTGRIKYAEDYTREGMVYARLLTSPIPHGRVLDIDASEALAMDGVYGILTADDVYPDGEPQSTGLKILTNEPTLVGEPILAVAAVDEKTAETAIASMAVIPLSSVKALSRRNGQLIRLLVFAQAMNLALSHRPSLPTETWTHRSRKRPLFMKTLSLQQVIPICPWSRVVQWPTGKMANCTCTEALKASPLLLMALPAS